MDEATDMATKCDLIGEELVKGDWNEAFQPRS